MPPPGFQAVILCGPGVSLDTFSSQSGTKALIPIANRPMVWYPMDFCYRMGITNITLITPPASAAAISTALSTNPHLTSLPAPKPILLAPKDLDQTTGTAQIFRLPEVKAAITGDFVVLPCDLVCSMGGEALIEAWMIREAALGGTTAGGIEGPKNGLNGEAGGRRGGLGVWYSTKSETPIKSEETDFIATTPLPPSQTRPSSDSLLPHISNLVYSMPTDTLNDITSEKKSLPIRHQLLKTHPRLRMLTAHRDAHIYIFPYWILDFIAQNEVLENLSEDVIGWWAKSGWQPGLAQKLKMDTLLSSSKETLPNPENDGLTSWEEADIGSLSSTYMAPHKPRTNHSKPTDDAKTNTTPKQLPIPPILAYIHPSTPTTPLIRRCDSGPLLLHLNLLLAKLDSIETLGRHASSPFAHTNKVANQAGIAPKVSVSRGDCLLAENVKVEEKSALKECVIGANCHIQAGAKLTRCLLMDGVVVGKGCKITGSILGRRSVIGADSTLQDCEVEDNMRIEAETEAKAEKFKSSEGLEAREEDYMEGEESDEGGSEVEGEVGQGEE